MKNFLFKILYIYRVWNKLVTAYLDPRLLFNVYCRILVDCAVVVSRFVDKMPLSWGKLVLFLGVGRANSFNTLWNSIVSENKLNLLHVKTFVVLWKVILNNIKIATKFSKNNWRYISCYQQNFNVIMINETCPIHVSHVHTCRRFLWRFIKEVLLLTY